jgi:Ca2+-binding EF-hand superfamily protein
MTFPRLPLIALALATLGSAAALAQPAGGMFEAIDADQDGAVTWAEVQVWETERFQTADTDHDGYLSRAEADAAREARMHDMFARFDTDGDGRVSRDEALRRFGEKFDTVDADHDGFVTVTEMGAMRAGDGRHGDMFVRLDADKDGRISPTEAEELARRMFGRFDRNDDGRVTADERPMHGDRG